MLNFSREITLVIACSDNERLHRIEEKIVNMNLQNNLKIVALISGNAVIEAFEKLHPDLFIVDKDLKGVGAQEVCRWIRVNDGERHTAILMVSNEQFNSPNVMAAFLNVGADECLFGDYSDGELQARIVSLMRFKMMMDDLRKANFNLKKLILEDELTGLCNMRGFKKHFQEIYNQCHHNENGICLIMLDIDHFKLVNDKNNHLIGSKILVKTGQLLKQQLASYANSVVARYGGDEFVISLALKNADDAYKIAEKIRQAFADYLFVTDGIKLNLTISVGVSWVDSGFSGPTVDVIKLADIMLYRSKANGRNQVNMMKLKYPIDFDQINKNHGKGHLFLEDQDELVRVLNA